MPAYEPFTNRMGSMVRPERLPSTAEAVKPVKAVQSPEAGRHPHLTCDPTSAIGCNDE